MPELPEVETIKRTLETLVLEKTVQDLTIRWSNIIKHPDDHQEFQCLLQGETIRRIDRKGKFLLIYFDHKVLVSHLRMEGKYRVVSKEMPFDKHTHIIFHFTDGTDLRYNDVRKFGTMHLFSIGDEFVQEPLKKLGPDPFEAEYNLDDMVQKLSRTTRLTKAVLLDQTIVAGLGNIYVDEVLFLAGVHPERRANTLTETELQIIFDYIKVVLQKAVDQGGTTIRSYVDGQGTMGMFQQSLLVYGQTEEACEQCGTAIIKLKVAGRGTHICPSCQPREGTGS